MLPALSMPLLKITNKAKRVLLTFIALFLILLSGGYRLHSYRVLSFSKQPEQTDSTNTNIPTYISIEAGDINLAVESYTISDGTWHISPDKAVHMNESARIGDQSNIVIYAHNKPHLFGNLKHIQTGDRIVLTDSNGIHKSYIVNNTSVVSPNDISVIEPTDTELLTLYTCTGFADSKRLVVTAVPDIPELTI